MYVKIGTTEYTQVKNLSFSPETSIISDKVPVNQFDVDIVTDSPGISAGMDIELYDDLDILWARYWVIFAERIDRYTIRVRAESKISLLDRKTMDGTMYTNYPVEDLIDDIFSDFASTEYSLDSSFVGQKINGYMGHHSKRYRLQLVCFVLGAYVKTYFNDKIEILPLDDTDTFIPKNVTFWRPTVTYKDWVTAIKIKTFAYTQGTPTTTDEWVEDQNGDTYIQTSQEVMLTNPDAPITAPPNIVEISDVQIVNSSNVSGIISRLSEIYFNRIETDLDVINNGEYEPGQRVTVFTSEDTMNVGYIQNETFSFGVQARAKLKVTPAESRDAATLTINYMWVDTIVGQSVWILPVDYVYSIENPYVDLVLNKHRYVFRPDNETADGTMVAGGVTDTEPVQVALDYYDGTLYIISVDDLEQDGSEVDIE